MRFILTDPIFVRQLRVNERRKRTKGLGEKLALLPPLALCIALLFMRDLPAFFREAATYIFVLVLFIQAIAFQAAFTSASGLLQEREDNTMSALTISKMSPGRMIAGYWLHAMWLNIRVVLCFVPTYAILYWWGGFTIDEYLRSQWMALAYLGMLSMFCISLALLIIQSMERAQQSLDLKKEKKSGSGFWEQIFKNANTQNSSQAIFGLVFFFLFVVPFLAGVVASLAVATQSDLTFRANSVSEAIPLASRWFSAVGLVSPILAGMLDLRLYFFGYEVPAWIGFPIIYLTASLGLFLQARFYLSRRQFNVSKDLRISWILFWGMAITLLVGVLWAQGNLLIPAMITLALIMTVMLPFQTCLAVETLPEWSIPGEPKFPHRHILQHFYVSAPSYCLAVLAPVWAGALISAYAVGGPDILEPAVRCCLFCLLGVSTLFMLSRAWIAMGVSAKSSQGSLVIAIFASWTIAHWAHLMTDLPLPTFISDYILAWCSAIAAGLLPFAPIVENLAEIWRLAFPSNPPALITETMDFINREIGSPQELILAITACWFALGCLVSLIARGRLSQRVARRDRELAEMMSKHEAGGGSEVSPSPESAE